MKKLGIIIALVLGTTLAAQANAPLTKNRKHVAKFEVAAPQNVQHTKGTQVNYMEFNKKFTNQNTDKQDMDNATGGKDTNWKARNNKFK